MSVSGISVTDPGYVNRGGKNFKVTNATCKPYAPPDSVTVP